MWLLPLAALGLLAPGGLLVYWLLSDYTSLSAAVSDRLALAFFVDLLISTLVLAWLLPRGHWVRSSGPGFWRCHCLAGSPSASRCSSGSTGAGYPLRGPA